MERSEEKLLWDWKALGSSESSIWNSNFDDGAATPRAEAGWDVWIAMSSALKQILAESTEFWWLWFWDLNLISKIFLVTIDTQVDSAWNRNSRCFTDYFRLMNVVACRRGSFRALKSCRLAIWKLEFPLLSIFLSKLLVPARSFTSRMKSFMLRIVWNVFGNFLEKCFSLSCFLLMTSLSGFARKFTFKLRQFLSQLRLAHGHLLKLFLLENAKL